MENCKAVSTPLADVKNLLEEDTEDSPCPTDTPCRQLIGCVQYVSLLVKCLFQVQCFSKRLSPRYDLLGSGGGTFCSSCHDAISIRRTTEEFTAQAKKIIDYLQPILSKPLNEAIIEARKLPVNAAR